RATISIGSKPSTPESHEVRRRYDGSIAISPADLLSWWDRPHSFRRTGRPLSVYRWDCGTACLRTLDAFHGSSICEERHRLVILKSRINRNPLTLKGLIVLPSRSNTRPPWVSLANCRMGS